MAQCKASAGSPREKDQDTRLDHGRVQRAVKATAGVQIVGRRFSWARFKSTLTCDGDADVENNVLPQLVVLVGILAGNQAAVM